MRWIIGVTLLGALVPAGCSDRGDWTGEWIGRRPLNLPPGEDRSVAETLALVRLTVRPDGTFRLTEEGFAKTGSGSYGSDTATLNVREVDGLRPSETRDMTGSRKLALNKDGTVVFVREGDPPVVLTRRPKE
ncbi:MAG: hypothetical protein JST30_10680 [Armatimonadetes bacterium]|nr:hypothetical protein [Armatimonadota bacterium]